MRVVGVVNSSFLGLNVIAHVSIATRGSIEPVTNLARQLPEIVFVSAIGGEFDLVMEVRVRTHDELHALLARFRAHPSVASLSTLVYSRVIRGAVAHESYDAIALDDTDVAIIRILQGDGRASYQSLADAVGLSPSALRARLRRMLDSRVLKIGVVEARGVQGGKLTMGIGLGIGRDGDAFARLMRTAEAVEFAAETVGLYDVIATIAAPTPGRMLTTLESLREHPAVTRFTAWTHLASIKEDYTRRV